MAAKKKKKKKSKFIRVFMIFLLMVIAGGASYAFAYYKINSRPTSNTSNSQANNKFTFDNKTSETDKTQNTKENTTNNTTSSNTTNNNSTSNKTSNNSASTQKSTTNNQQTNKNTQVAKNETGFTKDKALSYLQKAESDYSQYIIIQENGQYYFGTNNSKVISIIFFDIETSPETGKNYYGYKLVNMKNVAEGGSGTIENGYIYEDGTVELE